MAYLGDVVARVVRAAVVASSIGVAGCATFQSSEEGIVFDSSTGKPISDAFVLSEWDFRGADIVGSRSGCRKVVIVRSDANGRFSFPAGSAPQGFGYDRAVYAYMPGYDDDHPQTNYPHALALKPFAGSFQERKEFYRHFSFLRSCTDRGNLYQTLTPLYEAIDREIESLTNGQQAGSFAASLLRLQKLESEKRAREGAKQQ